MTLPNTLQKKNAQKAYRKHYEDPIFVIAGEMVSWKPKDSEWAGWVWCIHPWTKKEGWIPEKHLRIESTTAHVLKDYSANELNAEPDGIGAKINRVN